MKIVSLSLLLSVLCSCGGVKKKLSTKEYWDETILNRADLGQIINDDICNRNELYFFGCIEALNYSFSFMQDKPFVFTLKKYKEEFSGYSYLQNSIKSTKGISWVKRGTKKYQKLKDILIESSPENPSQFYKDSWIKYFQNGGRFSFEAHLDQVFKSFLGNPSYMKKVGEKYLIASMINRYLVALVGPYSYIKPLQKSWDQNSSVSKQYHGIGISFTLLSSGMRITRVYEAGPAFKAGLQIGDKIISFVDLKLKKSFDLTKDPTSELSGKLKGPAGSDLELKVLRNTKTLKIKLTRQKIEIPRLSSKIVGQGGFKVLHLRLLSFYHKGFCSDLKKALEKAKLVDAIVLDLRGNSGGSMTSCKCLAGAFLKNNQTLFYKSPLKANLGFSNEGEKGERSSVTKSLEIEKPLAVLVDRGSASASELASAALQFNDRAIVLGEKTVGKAWSGKLHSKYFLLPFLTSLRFFRIYYVDTVFYGPGFEAISGVGITPDIFLKSIPGQKRKLARKSREEILTSQFSGFFRPSISNSQNANIDKKHANRNVAIQKCLKKRRSKMIEEYNIKLNSYKQESPDFLVIQAREAIQCMLSFSPRRP